MEKLWDRLAGLGTAYLEGQSQRDIAQANAAAARAKPTNWTPYLMIGGAIAGIIGLVLLLRK